MRSKIFSNVATAVITIATVITSSPFLKPALAEWNYRTLTDTSDALDTFWGESLADKFGVKYYYPVVHTHKGPERTPCGVVQLAHYCENSNTIHLNMPVMNSIAFNRGDSAAYFALAHEYGHSVQKHLRLLGRGIPTPELELQADCLAGVFFAAADYVGLTEPGDIEEGMFFALMVGDDNYEDADHHGTPEERMQAFTKGFVNPNACFRKYQN